ncbi:Toxoplasma gondii family C protein [Toxoplasma gondii GT1]|uniref:Toxoplasma gondii family C protein n=3 Tax=Toxoplasma gondii TaxID=5811 RepID=S7VZB8_TOXGG|nr:Toxoplasma gondii family C protein [Toxoplasma gondii GT1]KFG40100.1 Toxoplasma gondii family C protein [Toxoplasma gondii FOU]RQX67361.1 Toxoplasma gondii family C protein [Toxoplasma gondii CAST]
MTHTIDRVVASRGVTNGEKIMVNVIGTNRSGFFTGFPLPSQLKARRGLLLYDSRVLLFLVALYVTVFTAFVSFECSTCRICTALAHSFIGVEMDPDWSGSHSWTDIREDTTVEGDGGATGADGSAAEVNYEALGELLIAYDALETLRNRAKAAGVLARVSRVQRAGRTCPIAASGILAGVLLSVLVGALFLKKGQTPVQETTPTPSKSSNFAIDGEEAINQLATEHANPLIRKLVVAELAAIAGAVALYLMTMPEPLLQPSQQPQELQEDGAMDVRFCHFNRRQQSSLPAGARSISPESML